MEIVQSERLVSANKSSVVIVGGGPYRVPLAELRTPLELINWIKHLNRKRWMTPLHMQQFIDAVCEAKGWKVDG